MTARTYHQPDDYATLRQWWKDSDCYVPDATHLDTLGIIVGDGNTDYCYMCAYCSDSVPVAFLDYLVTNPAITSAVDKMRAIDALMEEMIRTLRARGYQLIKAVTWSVTLAKICRRRYGFKLVTSGAQDLCMMI